MDTIEVGLRVNSVKQSPGGPRGAAGSEQVIRALQLANQRVEREDEDET